MPPLATDAIVLHAFPYSETSRILRLATRDAGVQSVLARGARRGKGRFSAALDLFAQGTAQLYMKEGRDLQTLAAFDVTIARSALAADLSRFTAASATAELMLRFGTANEAPDTLFDTLTAALDRIAAAPPLRADEAGLAGAWHLVAELGFAPSMHSCALCHAPVTDPGGLPFSSVAGGVLCASCASRQAGARVLPAAARACIAAWSTGVLAESPGPLEIRAHQRLLREFLQEHLLDGRPLRAFTVWEHGGWSAA